MTESEKIVNFAARIETNLKQGRNITAETHRLVNFPHVNDYRNNVAAEIMKTFDYVNMFNHVVTEVDIACNQLFTNCSDSVNTLIICFVDKECTKEEIQLATKFATKSRQLFDKVALTPALKLKLIAQTHPESPRHPHQKYYLTDLGKAFKRYLKESNRKNEDL